MEILQKDGTSIEYDEEVFSNLVIEKMEKCVDALEPMFPLTKTGEPLEFMVTLVAVINIGRGLEKMLHESFPQMAAHVSQTKQ